MSATLTGYADLLGGSLETPELKKEKNISKKLKELIKKPGYALDVT